MTLNKIKEARQKVGLNQKQLAKMLEVSASTLSEYEKGSHEPKSDVLGKIADICGVSVDFLLCREDIKENPPAPAEPEQGDGFKLEVFENMLVQAGFVGPDEDLTDSDVDFLLGVYEIFKAWFSKR